MFCRKVERVLDGRQGVHVHDAVHALVVILQGDIVLDRAQVIAQMRTPGGADAGKDAAFFSHKILAYLFLVATSSRCITAELLHFLFGDFFDQPDHFTRFGVTPGLEFGKNKLPVYADLVTASTGRNQRYAFNLRFKIFEQIICQAHGPVGIVSNRAINDLDFHHDAISWFMF